jgi:hypothetical protein
VQPASVAMTIPGPDANGEKERSSPSGRPDPSPFPGRMGFCGGAPVIRRSHENLAATRLRDRRGGHWAIFFRANMNPDSIEQFQHASSGRFNDWHPPAMAVILSGIMACGGDIGLAESRFTTAQGAEPQGLEDLIGQLASVG